MQKIYPKNMVKNIQKIFRKIYYKYDENTLKNYFCCLVLEP